MTALLRRHLRQHAHAHPQRTEIIELHGALEIVEAIVRILDRPADRAAGIIDEDIDRTMGRQHLGCHRFGIRHVGQITDVGMQDQSGRRKLGHHFVELLLVAGNGHHHRAGLGQLAGQRLADARRGTGHQHDFAADLTTQAAVNEEIGVEMALPVIPQAPGIAVERRHGDARALERPGRFPAVEAGRVIDELEHVVRQAEILHHRMADATHRRQRQQGLAHVPRDEAEQCRVDAHGHFRGMRGAGKGIEQIADAHRQRIDKMEALAVLALEVGDVVDGIDDEVDRHDVDPPALDADGRHPRRQHLAHFLDQFEEIVRTVDLVHLAGARITDDDRRAVDTPGNLALTADDAFRIVLGAEIRMIQPLCLLEHVLSEQPLEHAGRGNRTEQVEVFGANRLGKAHRIARAFDIDPQLAFGIGRQIVNGGEVEEMRGLFCQLFAVDRRYTEQVLRQIAEHRFHPAVVASPEFVQIIQPLALRFTGQEKDAAARAFKQLGDEAATDETGGPGDEILHVRLPIFMAYRPHSRGHPLEN